MDLSYRQTKIQEKRKQTPWRDFVMEICGWFPLSLNRSYGTFSRYPQTDRIGGVATLQELEQHQGITGNDNGDFYQSLIDLMNKSYFVPVLHWGDNHNVDYADIVLNAKNAYLSIAVVGDTENVLYSRSVKHNCQDIISSIMVRNGSANIFESSSIINSFNVFYSHTVQDSSDIWFSQNLIGCKECILCSSLQNQSYCIRNQQLSQEEYFRQKLLILEDKNNFDTYSQEVGFITHNQGSDNCTGQSILNSDSVTNGYFSNNISHGNNVVLFGSNNDSEYIYDAITGGSPSGKHIYGGISFSGEHLYCGSHCEDCSHVYYSYDVENCSFCLGCIGLKNESYCILNKQYTKEEWHDKVDEIFSQMEADGTLGQFFPASMNPFYFNDTAAYLIDPSFTKEEVTAAGYLWRDDPIQVDIPEWMEVISSNELGKFEKLENGVRSIDPIILKKTIRDEEGNIYRFIKLEYDFLVKYGLPLPRKHWLKRMKENFRIS